LPLTIIRAITVLSSCFALTATTAEAGLSGTSDAQKAAQGGCDSLNIDYQKSKASFSSIMDRVEKRINDICGSQMQQSAADLTKTGNDCAGDTAGLADDTSVSVDLQVKNILNRSQQICQTLAKAKQKIRGGGESFCSRLSKRERDAAGNFSPNATAFASGYTPAHLQAMHDQLQNTSKIYGAVATDAGDLQKSIDQDLPPSTDPGSARTRDAGLEDILKMAQKARSEREKKMNTAYQEATKAKDARKMAGYQTNHLACQALQNKLQKHVDLMENNLLPNGRMMSKLVGAAGQSAKEEQRNYEKVASQDLAIVKMQASNSSMGSSASDITGTSKADPSKFTDSQKDAAIWNNKHAVTNDNRYSMSNSDKMYASSGNYEKTGTFTKDGTAYNVYHSKDPDQTQSYAAPAPKPSLMSSWFGSSTSSSSPSSASSAATADVPPGSSAAAAVLEQEKAMPAVQSGMVNLASPQEFSANPKNSQPLAFPEASSDQAATPSALRNVPEAQLPADWKTPTVAPSALSPAIATATPNAVQPATVGQAGQLPADWKDPTAAQSAFPAALPAPVVSTPAPAVAQQTLPDGWVDQKPVQETFPAALPATAAVSSATTRQPASQAAEVTGPYSQAWWTGSSSKTVSIPSTDSEMSSAARAATRFGSSSWEGYTRTDRSFFLNGNQYREYCKSDTACYYRNAN
jgi:hypothetical protein